MRTETISANIDRNFKVQITPCVITKRFDRCIVVKLGTIAVEMEDGSTRIAEVEGAFSRDGLHALLDDLEAVPDPVGLPSQQEVSDEVRYQWAVVTKDGEHYQQYAVDGSEKAFAEIHLPGVKQFWIVPRYDPNSLPWYGLIAGKGFVKRNGLEGGDELLDLPHPGDEPFEWHYYRNNTLTFTMAMGQSHRLPTHVVQCLGWRIGTMVFEIGVETDGYYSVWKREPLENPPLW